MPTQAATALRVSETAAGIARGWRYIPLTGKRAILKAWQKRSVTPEQMIEWATAGNVGIRTGEPSGVLVIDLDGIAASRLDEFPVTPTVDTGGGGHQLYYAYGDSACAIKNWVGELGEHIDVRTTGGYVVAVGSIHPETHRQYVWHVGRSPEDMDYAPCPVDLIDKLYAEEQERQSREAGDNDPSPAPAAAKPPVTRKASGDHVQRFLDTVIKGEVQRIHQAIAGQNRNSSLNEAAYNLGQLVGNGLLSEGEADAVLYSAASAWIGDNCDESEIRATIRSGLASGKRNPRPAHRLPSFEHQDRPLPEDTRGEEITEIPDDYRPAEAEASTAAAVTSTPVTPLDPVTSTALTGEPWAPGEIDPQSKRVILSPKKTIPTAEAYLRLHHAHDEHHTLLSCGRSFWKWEAKQNCWREVEPDHLHAHMARWMHQAVMYRRSNTSRGVLFTQFESNPGHVEAALHTLRALTAIPQDTPTPHWLRGEAPRPLTECIAFKTSTMHIPSEETFEPTPRLWITNALEFDYNADAPAPAKWLEFLHHVLEGEDQIELLQEWFGYCLTPDMSQHKMFLFVGPPRCGKGTVGRLLERLVGLANVCNPSVQDMADNYGLSAFVGKLLAIFGDARWTSREAALTVEKLLRVSGGDGVNIRRMYTPSLTNVKLPTRIMILANDTPQFYDASGAMANRFVVVRSYVSFLGRENLKLESELVRELPGILLWAIEGWKRLRAQGRFTVTATMREEIADMTENASPVMEFVRECCSVAAEAECDSAALWEAWTKWCGRETTNRDPGTRPQFGLSLRSAFPGVRRVQQRDGQERPYYYRGLELKAVTPLF